MNTYTPPTLTETITYTVRASTAEARAYESTSNTDDDWACGAICSDDLPKLVADADGREFEWTGRTTAAAIFDGVDAENQDCEEIVYFELVAVEDWRS